MYEKPASTTARAGKTFKNFMNFLSTCLLRTQRFAQWAIPPVVSDPISRL
jgi:hypothetical protein